MRVSVSLARTVREKPGWVAEEALGTRLFDRDTRRVTFTSAGQELLHIARRVLGDFDSALSELSHFMKGKQLAIPS